MFEMSKDRERIVLIITIAVAVFVQIVMITVTVLLLTKTDNNDNSLPSKSIRQIYLSVIDECDIHDGDPEYYYSSEENFIYIEYEFGDDDYLTLEDALKSTLKKCGFDSSLYDTIVTTYAEGTYRRQKGNYVCQWDCDGESGENRDIEVYIFMS